MKYLFIVNPAAGRQNALPALETMLRQWFAEHEGYDWQMVETKHSRHAYDIARAAAESGEEICICACGGDGTLSEVVSGVYGFDNVQVAHYPCGSGNDFVKCYGEADAFRSVEAVVEGVARPIDLLMVNDCLCMNLISVGIDADVAAGMNKWRRYKFLSGQMCYNLAVVGCLLKPLGKHMRVTVGEETEEGDFMLAAAGNGRVYGGGYIATPDAEVDDGIMDVVTVSKIPLLRILKVLGVYKRGDHFQNGEVVPALRDCLKYRKTNHLRISADKPFVLNVDGEIIHTTDVEVTMLHHALKFVVPAALAKQEA